MSERDAVLARAAAESKDWDRARAHAEVAVAGGYAAALQVLILSAYRQRDYWRAIGYLEEVGNNGGDAATALLIRLYLLVGETAKGFHMLREAVRSKTFGPSLYDLPNWSGQPLAGRRIVAWGNGLGDDMLFARFLPPLVQAGARLAVNCRPALVRLFRGIPGIEEVQPLEVPIAGAEYQIQPAELPALLGIGAADVWPGKPYLHAEPARIPGTGLRVGLVWGSDARHWEAEDRTAALADMTALADVPGVTLYSLQVGAQARQAVPPPEGMRLIHLAHGLPDFADVAAMILGLDLVISIDTAVANLAGALGAPVWVALPFVPDFRWAISGDRTPWFPSARCFRQPEPGNWRSVFAAMADELRTMQAARS